ncbi:MAG: hypothetical protein J7M27_01205 [Candidatus Latescibacteria bacterium]|nr:hypothetical protein [Candidatus Latescibacterota bacterium]
MFTANDLIAVGVLGYTRERGIRIPENDPDSRGHSLGGI